MHKTREDRQREAIERDLARASRTTDEQLRLIEQRPGNSAKETARLMGNGITAAPPDELDCFLDVECTASPDGYHMWRRVAEDMYECEACGLSDC